MGNTKDNADKHKVRHEEKDEFDFIETKNIEDDLEEIEEELEDGFQQF